MSNNPETVPYTDFQKVQLANQALKSENEGQAKIIEELKGTMAISKPAKATLFGKMAVVMSAVKRVPKNGWNSFHKYNYPTETDLLEAVREILAEAGLAFFPTILESERVLHEIHDKYDKAKNKFKWFTRIKMEFTLGCTDTGETIKGVFHGEGQDDDDKGLYKAYTNTLKYFLRQTFLIPTGDVQPDDDGRPMDAEYAPPSQGYTNDQKQPNKGGGGKTTQNTKPTQNKPTDGAQAITRESLVEKWKSIGGTDTNFTPFYDKQIKDGKNHTIINKWLEGKIAERKKQQTEGTPDGNANETN